MEAYLVELLTLNPWMIWVGLVLLVLLFGLAVYQGREFGILGFKFGPKATKSAEPHPTTQRIEATQHQTIPVTIYNSPPDFSNEQYQTIYQRLKSELVAEQPKQLTMADLIAGPAEPPEKIRRIFNMLYAVRKRYTEKAERVFGGHMGYMVSRTDIGAVAAPDYDYLLNPSLLKDVELFETWVPTLFMPFELDDQTFERIMVLGAYILMQIEHLPDEPQPQFAHFRKHLLDQKLKSQPEVPPA